MSQQQWYNIIKSVYIVINDQIERLVENSYSLSNFKSWELIQWSTCIKSTEEHVTATIMNIHYIW